MAASMVDSAVASMSSLRQKERRFAAGIVNNKRWILACFATKGAFSCYQAPELFEAVQDQMSWDVLKGTQTADAQAQLERHFPHLVGLQTESLLLRCLACASLVEEPINDVVQYIVHSLNRTIVSINATRGKGWIQKVTTYYDLAGAIEPNPFLSADHKTMLFQWNWRVLGFEIYEATAVFRDIVFSAERLVETSEAAHFGLYLQCGGPFATHRDVMRANVQDSGGHAVAFLPVALLLLGGRVGSVTLMLVPIITAAGSMATSFAVVSLICSRVVVNATAPALVAFFNIALSVDYSLFLLTRYADERRAGTSVRPALEIMVENSGIVVLISGCVITAASLSAVFLPGGFLGMSLATAIACISCMAWNLLVTPAMIASIPSFFERGSVWNYALRTLHMNPLERRQSSSAEASVDMVAEQLTSNPWFCWGSMITQWPFNLIIVLTVFFTCTPLLVAFARFSPSIDMALSEPRGAPSTNANDVIHEIFSAGIGCPSPIYVLVKPRASTHCPNTLRSNQYFRSTCGLAQRIVTATVGTPYALSARNMIGIAFHPSFTNNVSTVTCISWYDELATGEPDAFSMVTGNGLFEGIVVNLRKTYVRMWDALASRDEHASIIAIAPPFRATSADGLDLVTTIRRVLNGHNRALETSDACGLETFLLSKPSAIDDFVSVTLRDLPIAIGCTMLVAFVLVGASFCAFFLPIKLFITVAMPLLWAYGLSVLVYQDGLLNNFGVESLKQSSGLLWSVPVLTCTLLCGLGLDYDIFLFSRIWEFRLQGYGNTDSIRLGLASTGGTIALAGLIFVLEFSGALLSTIPANNQIGAVIAIAVMIDVTIVETCFVPSLLSLGSDLNWWPVKMPVAWRRVVPSRSLQDDGTQRAAAIVANDARCEYESVPILQED